MSQKKPQDGLKMHHVKMPESVYQLLMEVRRQLAAAGTQCYHRSESRPGVLWAYRQSAGARNT